MPPEDNPQMDEQMEPPSPSSDYPVPPLEENGDPPLEGAEVPDEPPVPPVAADTDTPDPVRVLACQPLKCIVDDDGRGKRNSFSIVFMIDGANVGHIVTHSEAAKSIAMYLHNGGADVKLNLKN